jgi:hypothetical protein
VLDLPRPPSVNRFMRKLGNKSPCVRAWVGEADYYLWAARKARQLEPVKRPSLFTPEEERLLRRG